MPGSSVYRDVAVEVVVAAIVGEARAGARVDHQARVGELFDRHQQRLYRLARRMSRDGESARDLVQETFVRAARAVNSVPAGEGPEAAWLVRVLVNICRDEWRRQNRERAAAAPDVALSSHPEAARLASLTIWRALQKLTPRRRAAVVMYELEGTPIPEIARLLGVTAVTVRWHLSRGRRELKAAVVGSGFSRTSE